MIISAYVVELEQGGEDRAKQGESLMPRLARDLAKRDLTGPGLSMLKDRRLFHLTDPQIAETAMASLPLASTSQSPTGKLAVTPICATASGKPQGALPTPLTPEHILQFSWMHPIELLRLDRSVEARVLRKRGLLGAWSVRQRQRQTGSQRDERTGLSRNKRAFAAGGPRPATAGEAGTHSGPQGRCDVGPARPGEPHCW